MSTTHLNGELQIDHEKGVIYFYDSTGLSTLRICALPRPIPPVDEYSDFLDITHMYGCSWGKTSIYTGKGCSGTYRGPIERFKNRHADLVITGKVAMAQFDEGEDWEKYSRICLSAEDWEIDE